MIIKIIKQFVLFVSALLFLVSAEAGPFTSQSLTQDAIIKELGWVQTNANRCGGYYLEAPITYPQSLLTTKAIQITSNELLFAQHGTSIGQGKVTITRYGQQIVANKAYLYRDPETGKISSVELIENVTLREPNSLVIANRGSFNLQTKAESLHDILYRTAIYSNRKKQPIKLTNEALQQPHMVYQLSAWGEARSFIQDEPKVYELSQASYSTCAPTNIVWKVKASHIELNKETGKGKATHARILVKGVPVFYVPYLSFPLDSRRKTGFLWPTIGGSGKTGAYLGFPFYWNMAPNYDMTITPAYLGKRAVMVSDMFRYLTPTSKGELNVEVLPHDRAFAEFQQQMLEEFGNNPNPIKQSELNQLLSSDTMRKALNYTDKTRFNQHWSSNVDFNYVSDDYYLRDIDDNFNQVTQNQLLRLGELTYEGQHWNFTGRVQGYQTLHPVDENVLFKNQYTRLPQLLLNGSYPDNPSGFDYFISNDVSHFIITKNPGDDEKLPVGNRFYTQPGIARPFNYTYLTVTPRLQLSLSQYELDHVKNDNSTNPGRALPILDVDTSLYFDRNVKFLSYYFRQTLEPRFYYTYIPYRNQDQIPIFDTTVNTLTYDQLFLYNRFSGIDRINDANQVAMGLTTRFIDQKTGLEKIRAALGQILYFESRRVTLCSAQDDPSCPPDTNDFPDNSNNHRTLSPLSGLLSYTVNQNWSATANSIWNPQTKHLDNQSVGIHYQPAGTQKIINMGYNYVRDGDRLQGEEPGSTASNLSSTDFSFNWPVSRDWSAIGRWTQNWNHNHFQNLLYGLQYDTCCWAMRIVTGRAFTGLNPSNTFQYNTQFFIQIALKGLGTVPVYGGDPSQLLNNISGIQNNFGQDF